jgi:hypothetical protein
MISRMMCNRGMMSNSSPNSREKVTRTEKSSECESALSAQMFKDSRSKFYHCNIVDQHNNIADTCMTSEDSIILQD